MDASLSEETGPHHGYGERVRQRLAHIACNFCRLRKLRCDEKRPTCTSCCKHGIRCVYETRGGETQKRLLRSENDALRKTIEQLHEALDQRHSPHSRFEPDAASHRSDPQTTFEARLSLTTESLPPVQSMKDSTSSVSSDRPVGRSKAAAVALLEALIAGSDGESTLLLARLRLGDQIEDIAGIRMLSQFGNVPLPDSDIADQQPQARRCSFGPSPVPGLEEAFARELWMDDKSAQSASEHTMASWSRHCMPNNVMSIAPLHDCHFDNASLPCTAGLTGQPTSRQDRHKGDFHLPVWAIQTMNCLRSLTVADPFETVITELKKKIGEGADGEDLCGPHAYIAALYDEATFMRAPQLSKMVVSIVNSIRSEDSSPAAVVTTYATMWLYWALFRWMLIPSSQTYCDVPVLFRPTPWQVFAPHMRIYDFIIWPSLREHICQQPSDADMRWFTEACMAVKCDWPWGVSRALCLDPSTNEVDLSIFCKTHIESAGNWPLGPSIDQYMRNQVPMGFNDTSV